MRRSLMRPLLGWLALLALAGCSSPQPPAERELLELTVDAQSAMNMVEAQVAIGPRHSNSEGARQTAAYIARQAESFGYEPTIDTWEEQTASGLMTFHNVYATLAGQRPGFILLASHFDTKRLPSERGFEGANDAASSTGLLLEIMRVLQQDVDQWPGPELRFAFFDGEESLHRYTDDDGLHGSKRLAARYAASGEAQQCQAMILLDMVGDADLRLTLCRDDDPTLLALALRIAEEQGVRDHLGFFTRGTILDDHVPFKQIGIPAIDLIDFEYGPANSYWHTRHDTLDKLSPESLRIVGDLVLHMIQEVPQRKTSR